MAESMCDRESSNAFRSLKPEQKIAVDALLAGKDVFAVLPTGFGKSFIYQTFVLERAKFCKNESTVPDKRNIRAGSFITSFHYDFDICWLHGLNNIY